VEATVQKGRSARSPGPDLPYTSRAKKVLELAMTEARELDHSYVGTEHLLLGLLREEKGIAAQVLRDAGLELDAARAETRRLLGAQLPPSPRPAEGGTARRQGAAAGGAGGAPAIQLTHRARRVLAFAREDATRFGHPETGTEHILFALLREGEGEASVLLDALRVDRAALRDAVDGAIRAVEARPADDGDALYARDARRALQFAAAEAREDERPRASTADLLLGLLHATRGAAAQVLGDAGVTLDAARRERERLSG
jgi:ATP-dependent Clp protease ATP-binding subunit ClpA